MASSLKILCEHSAELDGDFVIEQLPQLLAAGEAFISAHAGQSLSIDLAKSSHAKSIILSLLLSWLRCAKKHNVKLLYLHPPQALMGLAKISSLDKVLFGETSAAA
jgi:ABC-type transporter Mla MlaB component